jgi:hypothetical protein
VDISIQGLLSVNLREHSSPPKKLQLVSLPCYLNPLKRLLTHPLR